MYNVDIIKSGHNWEKKNLVTKIGKNGMYDEMECQNCGMKGRRYNLSFVTISESYSEDHAMNCPKAETFAVPEIVKITYCNAYGKVFSNLKPGSEHAVIPPPEGYKNDRNGVWVMGVGKPVKVLTSEFVIVRNK